MFTFRVSFTNRRGEQQETKNWYVGCALADGRQVRVPGFVDKPATEAFGRKIERLIALKAAGESLPLDLLKWLEGLPDANRKALNKLGLLGSHKMAASKTLADHVADWKRFLEAKQNTPKHCALVTSRAQAVIDGCGFTFISELDASRVMTYLAELRENKDGKDGISNQTSNFYLASIKQFCRWLCRDGRASANPLEYLEGLNVRTDRRHDRRALEVDEIRWLLDTAAKGPDIFKLTGPTRALLYMLALESGLRSAELASLTRESFQLDADPPTVTVAAGYSKHRRADELPLRPETAAKLRDLIATTFPGVPVFPMPRHRPMSEVLAEDLGAARQAWLDEEGIAPEEREKREKADFLKYVDAAGRYVDFHALRHSTGSLLAAAGVHPKTAQAIMRHSDINLTLSRYSHTYSGDEAAAVAKLPDFAKADAKNNQKQAQQEAAG